jgi:hypothetical protein
MLRKKLLPIGLFFIALFIFSCKKKDADPRANYVDITMNILDENNQALSGAKVYILSSIADYEQSSALYKGVNAIDSTTSQNGQALVTIEGKKQYYLYIAYTDNTRKLVLANEGYSNVINELPKNLNVKVDIKLSPANANFGFWTTDKNLLPITLKIDEQTFTLSNSLTTPPIDVNNSSTIAYTVRKGGYSFYASNADGCVWTEAISIKNGEFKPIELTECRMNKIHFYTSSVNAAFLPIKVILNDTEEVGRIESTKESQACGEAETNTLTIKKEAGTFTYVAYSADNKCAWTGFFTVSNGSCSLVKLEECK